MGRTRRTRVTAAVVLLAATGCGYDGDYRYPCQDPDEWDSPDCQSPRCDVWGACPEDLVPTCGAMLGRDCRGV